MTAGPQPIGLESGAARPLYVQRVNAVIDFIEQHLAEELTLEQLAEVAHFSPFHFHRVFSVLVRETLNRFISRVRYEKAAALLIQQPRRRVTDIANDCGIPNPSSFARSFRETFGMSATAWRAGGYRDHERQSGASVGELVGNVGVIGDDYGIVSTDWDADRGRTVWEIRCGDLGMAQVEVVDIPCHDVAYVRRTGRYQGFGEFFADIFSRLMAWAGPRQLVTNDSWLVAVYHDNPSITDDDKLRVSACIDVPPDTQAEGEVGRMRLEGGSCAVARFELGERDYAKAWFAVAGGWLPDSGYEPDDRLPFERYPIGMTATAAETEVVEICIPVRPLRRY